MIQLLDRIIPSRLRALTCTRSGFRPEVHGRVWIHGGGHVRFGRGVVLDGSRGPIELHAGPDATITLGDEVRIQGGSSIEALESVTIEAGTTIGAWSKILDNHFHSLEGDRAHRPASEAVWIGPDVVLGERCIVLPGTRIGAGARLHHGVVIGRRVPPGAHLEGYPPRRVGSGGVP